MMLGGKRTGLTHCPDIALFVAHHGDACIVAGIAVYPSLRSSDPSPEKREGERVGAIGFSVAVHSRE